MELALEGIIERITYRSEETGYTVARLRPTSARGLVTIVGQLLNLQVGETVMLEGEWTSHPVHGRQFRVERYRSARPSTIEGIKRYLGSGLIKGIGPATAGRIVETFGAATLDILDRSPERLREVRGLGTHKIRMITAAWEEQRAIKDLIMLLHDLGLPTALASRVYRRFGQDSGEIVRNDPYRLADEIYGIGFPTADRLGRAQGIEHNDRRRLIAGLRYVISEAAGDEGHCYLPTGQLLAAAEPVLGVSAAELAQALESALIEGLLDEDVLPEGEQGIALPSLAHAERSLAGRLLDLLGPEGTRASELCRCFASPNVGALNGWLQRQGMHLNERQIEAIRLALTSPVAVLTGGPGTGKTTTVRAILAMLEQRGLRALLAAPTGRAARRLAEASGHPATTIHRLLEYRGGVEGRFGRDQSRPLEADLVVVDEASMLDVVLAHHLVKAIPLGCHLLFVGDVDQLPSVGPGAVLRDLLAAWIVPSVQLIQIFRQAEGSGIVANAHRINSGKEPDLIGLDDFFLFPRADPEECAAMVVELVTQRIPRRFGYDPQRDIQVLSPTHKGPAGVQSLNTLLQEALNPPRHGLAETRWGSTTYRVGDRVLQLRNNYDLDVANGDLGEIVAIDREERTLTVLFEGERQVSYDLADLDELALAYAISVHKGQGAEYPAVVIPLLRAHGPLLQRALLYTAVTRARRLVVLCGDRRAISTAVAHDRAINRWTCLARRLREGSRS